ncbi:hypothetical protein [Candidatus Methanodesulfokora washburnensis]|uniref:Uncharacterized protein n=1 Tax=Candidatus Methanodesulfokora washburnensis TaxID=2478471 RepID=A0A3R9PC22_9CREN|nr:hypothetical protein [Candidatus Methanodesulfokores washburnensis]RSN72241.1 hypothetical protein D6D85_14680 [Candidatus Methanodesulfokores washburnensis]
MRRLVPLILLIIVSISVLSFGKAIANSSETSISPAPQESRKICIPFSREEESIFQNFSRFERYSFYRVKNATIYAPDNIVDLFYLSKAKERWYREEIYKTPRLYELYLSELLRKEIKGDFSDEIKREIEIARGGVEYQYLRELVSWIDRGMSTEEMINLTLEKMKVAMDLLVSSARYYGAYLMLDLISENEAYSLEYCNPPKYPPPDGTWYYIYNWAKAGRVWVGCYYSSTPDASERPVKEFCTSVYTTDLNYYWNLAKSGYCKEEGTGRSIPGYMINSIQVKWFYSAQISGYTGFHDLIWEGNKNANSIWYTYKTPYKTTNPQAGYYMFHNYAYVLQCCYSPYGYCNAHCTWMPEWQSCFDCDSDATQHFISGQP